MYKPGQLVTVKITNITPFGAFCELPDATGLIHISEFSDYYVKDIRKFVDLNDVIEVEVLLYDEDKKQVKLSYKNPRPELLKKSNNRIDEKGSGFKPLKDKMDSLLK